MAIHSNKNLGGPMKFKQGPAHLISGKGTKPAAAETTLGSAPTSPKSPHVKRKDGDDASLWGTIKRDVQSKGVIGGILGVVSGSVFRKNP
mgnify:FL=1